jgi:threonylcarbamoyladenosine tRNA methylthiotransferase MtaB
MPVFKIVTLGCKVNQCESDGIGQKLRENGWTGPVDISHPIDLCIINTCAVTGKAAMQSRQAVRKLIREHPGALIVVTGCAAQVEAAEMKKIEGVHLVIPHQEKETIPLLPFSSPLPPRDAKRISVDPSHSNSTGFWPIAPMGKRTRPFLKIQDGCNAFCSYCIVPYARGRSRSMPMGQVISAINRLSQEGYHEVVLTGIHLGTYGLDLDPETPLSSLLEKILSSSPIERVRLSSIEPREVTPSLIRLIAGSPVLCDHFHIPLQSGSDAILTSMGRPYTALFFEELIGQIRDHIPHAAIGTDILTGYPGETEAHFTETFSLLERTPLSYFHVFPFSKRKGTRAYTMKNQVPVNEIKERSRMLRELGMIKRKAFMEKAVGEVREILIETERDKESGLLKGVSPEYIQVVTDGPDAMRNTLQKIRLERIHDPFSLFGTCTGGIS